MPNTKEKVILEVRAGTGGDEAALFAADLVRMYQKYAQNKGWGFNVLDFNKNDLGGFKSFVARITGESAYQKMKYESGVHRVQRIPSTEKSGRIHTSTASVAVLEEKPDVKIKIDHNDLDVSFFRSSGPGGQHANKVETGVRIVHKPTGVSASSQAGRSQRSNREKAMSILQARLYEAQKAAIDKKHAKTRKKQIGSAQRAEKIRTYNFPNDRIKDHRINKKWHNIETILDGDLDKIFKAFKKADRKKKKRKKK